MQATVLLIGGTGFAGSHMQRLLRSEYKVVVSDHTTDIRDPVMIGNLLKSSMPDYVVNFASVTTVKESFADPTNTYAIGFFGTLNVLLALKAIGFRGRMLNISSSEVYGFPSDSELPLAETACLRPMSPYSVSKAAAELLCYQWAQTERFAIVTARPFTHIGPGQSDRFAISSFAKQIAEILLHNKEAHLQVGNLQTTRDLTDVRDVVGAYKLLMEKGHNAEAYNICSGREVTMQFVVEQLLRFSGISIALKENEQLMRKAEQRRTCGSFQKLREHTSWQPKISLDRSLQDTLASWQERLS